MAKRPAFTLIDGKMRRFNFEFKYNSGFAVSQKKKNVAALHQSIGKKALEVSTKSDVEIGNKCSAFNLKLDGVLLECVFQAGKIYEKDGPYLDLLEASPKDAKRDPRHQSSGKLIGFQYKGMDIPTKPTTLFYDYLYCNAIKESVDPDELKQILDYEYFTDIEFNPERSVNCQARSIVIVKAMLQMFGEIPDLSSIADFESFCKIIRVQETV